MKRLKKFWSLSGEEKYALVLAATWLVFVHCALWLIPFRTLSRGLTRLERLPGRRTPQDPARLDQIVWAVEKAGRFFFGQNGCLAKALSGKLLLSRNGWDPDIQIGAYQDSSGRLHAHAWLKVDGRILIGGNIRGLDQFVPLS